MLRAFGSPSLYIQGPGALDQLPALIERLGRQAVVICDRAVAQLLGQELRESLSPLKGRHMLLEFGGECTAEEISRLTSACKDSEADVVVGVGGGKAIDAAKGVRLETGAPLVIVPTIASNDSPTSRICVVYTEDHILSHVRTMATNPDAVVVDTNILVRAPKRFFVSGVGDAITKKFEAAQCLAAGGSNFYGFKPPYIASLIAEQCFNTILEHAEAALDAIDTGQPNAAFERSVEAAILLSGLAFENGGLSIPHSLTRGLSSIPTLATALHGEQVAFGLIVHLLMERQENSTFEQLRAFYKRVGLPTTLADLGYDGDLKQAADQIAQVSIDTAPYIRNFAGEVTQKRISDAILSASAIGA